MRLPLVCGLALALLSPLVLSAQSEPAAPASSVALTAGRVWWPGEARTSVALQVSTVRPEHFLPEFGITAAFGDAGGGGRPLVLVDVGGNYTIRSGPALVLLRAGATAVFQAGGAGGALPGGEVGFSVLPWRGAGPRLDLTRRYYLLWGLPPAGVWSVGLGVAWSGRARSE